MARPTKPASQTVRLAHGVSLSLSRSGVYRVQFTDRTRVPYRKVRTLRTDDYGEAMDRARELLDARRRGEWDPWSAAATETPLGAAVRSYLAGLQRSVQAGERKPSYLRTQSQRLNGLAKRLGEARALSGLGAAEIAAFVATLDAGGPRAAASRHSMHLSVAGFFNWAVAERLVARSPAAGNRTPRRPESTPTFLSARDLERWTAAVEAAREALPPGRLGSSPAACLWVRDAALLAVQTGLRLGELCALQWRDVERGDRTTDWPGGIPVRLHVRAAFDSGVSRKASARSTGTGGRARQTPKWESGGRVPVPPAALAVLERLSARRTAGEGDAVPVVRNASGGEADPRTLSRAFRHYATVAKLPSEIDFHALRHTYASWLVMAGIEITTVSRLMRHKDVSTTARYAHLSPKHLQDSVAGVFDRVPGASPVDSPSGSAAPASAADSGAASSVLATPTSNGAVTLHGKARHAVSAGPLFESA